mgnify:CR=1 FL=1
MIQYIPRVFKQFTYAPDFEANTTMGQITLNQYKGKWVVLFSHPGDFTPV